MASLTEVFQAGLVSELSVVVSPQLDGCQGVPSIIEYRGEETDWPQGLTLRLLDVERLGAGCVWLHYQGTAIVTSDILCFTTDFSIRFFSQTICIFASIILKANKNNENKNNFIDRIAVDDHSNNDSTSNKY